MSAAGADITGIVLAGGEGRRMGRVDKGLQLLGGHPMVAHVIERLRPQVAALIINANRNADTYATFGFPVVADAVGGYAGPLAGLHAGLTASRTPFVVTVPCDSPLLPLDLVARLRAGLESAGAELAVARTGDQPHPVFCLCRRDLLAHLAAYLDGGGRKIDAWYATLAVEEVRFDDCAEAFSNVNTPEELQALDRSATRD